MKLPIYIDAYGRVGIVEKFEETEENAGLNEMLDELVREDFYEDRWTELKPGFYDADFELWQDGGTEAYLQIARISPRERYGK